MACCIRQRSYSAADNRARSANQAGTSLPWRSRTWWPSNQPAPASRACQVPFGPAGSWAVPGPTGVIRLAVSRASRCTWSAGNSTRSRLWRTPSAASGGMPWMTNQAPGFVPAGAISDGSSSTSTRARIRAVALMQQLGIQAPAGAVSMAALVCPCKKRRVSAPSSRSRLTACSMRLAWAGCQSQGVVIGPQSWRRSHPAKTGCAGRGPPRSWPRGRLPGDPQWSPPVQPDSRPRATG